MSDEALMELDWTGLLVICSDAAGYELYVSFSFMFSG